MPTLRSIPEIHQRFWDVKQPTNIQHHKAQVHHRQSVFQERSFSLFFSFFFLFFGGGGGGGVSKILF